MTVGSIAICGLSVIPVRAEHDDASEIVTQLLLGEAVKCIEIYKQWMKIEIIQDHYIGWVDGKQLLNLKEDTRFDFNTNYIRQQETELKIKTPWGQQSVLQGSPILSNDKTFNIDDYSFEWTDETPNNRIFDLQELAMSYLNAPYLWGGRTKYGIDCSGFTQTVFHQLGYFLHRDASQQGLQGEEISFDEQKTGDLAFFASKKTGNITHVGIVLPDFKIIHAHGRVRIDTLNTTGIYNQKEHYYSHVLYNLKRYAF
jgi:cell wall-associated NlpC family hydrolase